MRVLGQRPRCGGVARCQRRRQEIAMRDEAGKQAAESTEPGDTWGAPAGWEEEIAQFEVRNRIQVPLELREWLCSGPGTYEVEETYRFHPIWREKGWIPIAGDGCGNCYVLDTTCTVEPGPGRPLPSPTHPAYFMDHEEDDDRPSYAVASSFETFLHFMRRDQEMLRQGGEHYWPFDRE